MAEYTLKYINHRAECDAEACVNDCEEHYHRQLHLVADQIAANCKRKPVVLLNGPSSSGKTTTNDRLGRILELAGIHAHMISMDDYYRTSGTYDIPFDEENGVNDLESPECMDLDLLRDHLTRLVAGEEIMVPRFDFETRTSHRNDRAVQLHKDEIVMIEGIHAFNPVIMGDLEKHATSVYLSVASVLLTDHNIRVEPHMLRFLAAIRQIVRYHDVTPGSQITWNTAFLAVTGAWKRGGEEEVRFLLEVLNEVTRTPESELSSEMRKARLNIYQDCNDAFRNLLLGKFGRLPLGFPEDWVYESAFGSSAYRSALASRTEDSPLDHLKDVNVEELTKLEMDIPSS